MTRRRRSTTCPTSTSRVPARCSPCRSAPCRRQAAGCVPLLDVFPQSRRPGWSAQRCVKPNPWNAWPTLKHTVLMISVQAKAECEQYASLASIVQRYGHMYYHFLEEALPRLGGQPPLTDALQDPPFCCLQ